MVGTSRTRSAVEPPWWLGLEQVYVLEFVEKETIWGGGGWREPMGLYVNRAEIGGVWRDIILAFEGTGDGH